MFSKKCFQMIAESLLVYISQLDLVYDGDKLFDDLKTSQAILKSIASVTACQIMVECTRVHFAVDNVHDELNPNVYTHFCIIPDYILLFCLDIRNMTCLMLFPSYMLK